MERTGEYRGRYHLLLGALSSLDGIGPDDLKVKELLVRLEGGETTEVILATNPNVEGEATALNLAKLFRPLGIRVTRIARDRKSTRLNSSHSQISYAVFCLKKKKTK